MNLNPTTRSVRIFLLGSFADMSDANNATELDALFDDGEEPAQEEQNEVSTRLKRKRSVVDDDDDAEEAADDTQKESEAKRPKAEEAPEPAPETAPEVVAPMNNVSADDDIYPPEMTAEADAMLAD